MDKVELNKGEYQDEKQVVIDENDVPSTESSIKEYIQNRFATDHIEPEMRLYGVGDNYFETIDELLAYCRRKHVSTQYLKVLDYYRNFYDLNDVIRKTDSKDSIFYVVSSQYSYLWNCGEVSIDSENWEISSGQVRSFYKPFRDRGIVFEDDIYAREPEINHHGLK